MESRLTISGIAGLLADATGRSKKTCEDFIREFFRLTAEALLEGESIRIKGFGSFKISEVEARTSVDVSTGEPTEIEAYRKVVFTPSKEMAEIINSPFEAFESIEIDDDMPELEDETSNQKEETTTGINEGTTAEEEVIVSGGEDVAHDTAVRAEEEPIPILEAGSEEEELDDILTYEAYVEDDVVESILEDTTIVSGKEEETAISTEGKDQVVPVEEEKPAVLAEQENATPEETEEPEKVYIKTSDRYGRGFFAGAMTSLVVCLVIFMLGCFFDWWPVNFGKGTEEAVVENTAEPEVAEEPEAQPGDITIEAEEEEPVYDTVSTTRYLTTIARQHYGNFNFWPYIYIENQDILGHPDRITPGTKVVVPPLSKYGVDPNNKADEEEAKRKGIEIYQRFK